MSIRKTAVFLPLLAALALHAAPSQAQNLADLGGIKLRAPLQAQRAQIANMNPGYQITEITTTGGKVVGLQGLAFSSVTKKPFDQFVALQDESGNAWYLARAQRFDEGKYVPIESINKALAEKYGPHTQGNDSGQNRYWSFSPLENKINGGKEDRCLHLVSRWGGQSLSKLEDFNILIPQEFPAACGVVIRTYIPNWYQDKSFAIGYFVALVDYKPRYEVLERQNNAEAAARKKESDAMKDNKVKF